MLDLQHNSQEFEQCTHFLIKDLSLDIKKMLTEKTKRREMTVKVPPTLPIPTPRRDALSFSSTQHLPSGHTRSVLSNELVTIWRLSEKTAIKAMTLSWSSDCRRGVVPGMSCNSIF